MSRAVAELSQIPFEQLIGAPMKAAIEAQALAAQSTIEYIQKIGFKTSGGGFEPEDMLFADTSEDADAGELRNVTFKYSKIDETVEEGGPGRDEFSLTVPLLSITPIPYLRIDEMTIDFSAKLTDAIQRSTKSDFTVSSSISGKYSAFFSPVKMSFRVSSTYNTKSSKVASEKREYRMDIHVRAVQDEMPAGLSKILDILEDAIQDVKTDGD